MNCDTDDAEAVLLGRVREAFKDNPTRYVTFCRLVEGFKSKLMSRDYFISTIELLLREKPQLLREFHFAMKAASAYSLHQQKSVNLLDKIEKFDPETYWRFLDAVEHYRLGYLSADDLTHKVCLILHGHGDLFPEFFLFLQESSEDEEDDHQRKHQLVDLGRAASFVNEILRLSQRRKLCQFRSRRSFEKKKREQLLKARKG